MSPLRFRRIPTSYLSGVECACMRRAQVPDIRWIFDGADRISAAESAARRIPAEQTALVAKSMTYCLYI